MTVKPAHALAVVGVGLGLVYVLTRGAKAKPRSTGVQLIAGERYQFAGRIVPALTGPNLDAFLEQLGAAAGTESVEVDTRGNVSSLRFVRTPPISTTAPTGKIGSFLGTSIFIDSIRRLP